MRASHFFFPTLREAPADAEMRSYALLARGAFIRKLAAGVYSFMPLGLRVLLKIQTIVREEMNRQGAIEIELPVISPAELWKESGRYEAYQPPLAKFRDLAGREFVLGPTHEEIVTDLVRHSIHSYKQLPVNLYQIQTKFRDELRPRAGLIRAREFIMKDAYSFDANRAGLGVSFDKMYTAYCAIFDRCGLPYVIVEAEGGSIGGTDTNEFMVVCAAGEDTIMRCDGCGYAVNVEKAGLRLPAPSGSGSGEEELRKVATPAMKTVEQVTAFLKVEASQLVKTLLFKSDDQVVAALIRGDRELNEFKLKQALGGAEVGMADADTVLRVTGAPVGFAGPIGLQSVRLLLDQEITAMTNFVTGANEADAHFVNVNPGRDFVATEVADLRNAVDGDHCGQCDSGRYRATRGIEVGHIFKLGTKYSAAMNATFQDENGEVQPFIMGCYGIGVSRVLAAIAEMHNDEKGLCWPDAVAPFEVTLLLLDNNDASLRGQADRLYDELTQAGHEVFYDDRNERAGVKFSDADLIGIPYQVVIGKRTRESGEVEVRRRRDKTQTVAKLNAVADALAGLRNG